MKIFGYICLFFLAIIILGGIKYCNRTVNVVMEQIDPGRMLKEYERFKNLAAAIDGKLADIEMYKSIVKNEGNIYDAIGLQQKQNEMIGIIASHNRLCEDYNAAMAKINYAFCNVGKMPEGLEGYPILPREYRKYITSSN